MIFPHRIGCDLAIGAARRDHRQFAYKVCGSLEDAGPLPQLRKGGLCMGGVVAFDPDLTLAIIAIAAGLEQAWSPHARHRINRLLRGRDRGKGHGRDAVSIQEGLFIHPVLRHR